MHKVILLILSFLGSSIAMASDVYHGSLESTNRVGKTVLWRFDVSYQIKENKFLSGTLRMLDAGPCQGDQAIDGVVDGLSVEFKVREHQLPGCGGNRFIGKVESDALVGKYFFQGKFHAVTLKKQ